MAATLDTRALGPGLPSAAHLVPLHSSLIPYDLAAAFGIAASGSDEDEGTPPLGLWPSAPAPRAQQQQQQMRQHHQQPSPGPFFWNND